MGEDPHYGLPIFWDLIQDKAIQISNETMTTSINYICEILKMNHS